MKKFTLLLAIIAMASFVAKAQFPKDMEGLIGLYQFSNPDELFENTATETGVGTVLCEGVMKFLPDAPSGSEDDQPSVEGEDWEVIDGLYNNAISLNAHNWFKVWHGIPANGGGDYVNEFSVVIDVRISDTSLIYSLFEVNPTPSENGYTSEMEVVGGRVGTVGAPMSGADPLGFSDNIIEVDTWYRIIYAAKLSEGIYIYVNGELWHSMSGDFTDARPAPYGADTDPDDAAFKVGGNNEQFPANDPARDADKDIDLIAVFNRTITADEAATLEGPGSWLGVSDINENSINIYPNPVTDILNVTFDGEANLEIINAAGQVVISSVINGNSSLDVSKLNKGFYFVKVTGIDGKAITQKLIVE